MYLLLFNRHFEEALQQITETGASHQACSNATVEIIPGLQWRQDGKKSANAKAMHTQAASVQLYLIAQLGNNLGWQLRTAACSCSASLLPLKVCHSKFVA